MTFQKYFTECQTIITKEINLPFDCPFSDDWLNKYNAEFSMLQYYGLTPEEAVRMHFDDIDRRALIMKKRKTLMK